MQRSKGSKKNSVKAVEVALDASIRETKHELSLYPPGSWPVVAARRAGVIVDAGRQATVVAIATDQVNPEVAEWRAAADICAGMPAAVRLPSPVDDWVWLRIGTFLRPAAIEAVRRTACGPARLLSLRVPNPPTAVTVLERTAWPRLAHC